MVMRLFLLLASLGLGIAVQPADANQRGHERRTAWEAARDGKLLSLREIEARVLPRMRGYTYLGPELDGASGTYRLKFMRNGQVVWIDVDGRSGQIIRQSGN